MSVELAGWLLIQVWSVAVLSVFVPQVEGGADDVTPAEGSTNEEVRLEASARASNVTAKTMP